MDTPPAVPQKKGLGVLAWLGIGCGGIIVLVVIGLIVFSVMFGPKLKQFAEEAQKNPTRATATAMVTVGSGTLELVAEDDVNKRYTVKNKANGQLTTVYWDEKKKAPQTVQGDFSAIPADAQEAPSSVGGSLPSPSPAEK
jgi:hypothetical protein